MDNKYKIKELTSEEFRKILEKYRQDVFDNILVYNPEEIMTSEELENIEKLRQNVSTPYKLHLCAFDHKDNIVGWTWGMQENVTTYYMVNSGVLDTHRRKGIYTALLNKSLDIVTKMGFQLLYSRHCASNNNVIIPKLKAGFIMSKMEIDDRFGVLVHLHYYTNSDRRKIMDFRTGQEKPNEKTKKIFGLN